MKKRSNVTPIAVLIALTVIAYGLYRYGHAIPGLKEIPFFQKGHEHTLKPVLTAEGEIDYWTCAMHPSVKMKEPGTCPICAMELIPVTKKSGPETEPPSGSTEKETSAESASSSEMGTMDHSKHGIGVPAPGTGEGQSSSRFTVSPERQQMIGVRTEPVETRRMEKTIRTVGRVTLDETKTEQIHTKFSGWIDKLYVDYTLEHVKKGDPLFSIYSPELVSTQEEYLLALRSKEILSDSEFSDISGGANSLLAATEKRLRLWDISGSQIRELAETGKVKDGLVIYSPVSGVVTEKNVFENMYVEPGTNLYTITDHSDVWVEVDIYENEIPLVKEGDQAVMTLRSLPGEEFRGVVTFIPPHLDMKTRTVKARLEFPNPDLKLLPEMYADVEIDIPLGEQLAVPVSAVISTGTDDLVFVDKGGGKMEIRKVGIGRKAGGYYEVLKGLKEGESVVSRANFLIDSESKIQAAVATWGEDGPAEDSTGEHEGHGQGE
ncbi:MAG: efflux RND transporter periplasmic adaptor subunit [Candidatus Dadabacteria bacterium]|jgi:multidrug efflux pump subunit AcrA (membrane-fusion protein)|nr:efflux RND transporter periplasmic adaptor subunit [Candidatus Dadabacteria bacterium]